MIKVIVVLFRGVQIPDASLAWGLTVVQCCLISVDLHYGTCFMPSFRDIDFSGGTQNVGKICAPLVLCLPDLYHQS
jgi:hypothetical protein